MKTDARNEVPFELFMMQPKNEPMTRAPQTNALQQRAFGAQADAQNGEYAQNTTAWD